MAAVRRIAFLPVVLVAFGLAAASYAGPAATTAELPGLDQPVRVVRDSLGIPHVLARTDHDAYFMVGYLHAQDRLFQMDATRRQASGTLAELLGPAALPGDVQLRTLGLRRAGARSLAALSPESVAMLEAYAAGVNAWTSTHPVPSEYAALELTSFEPWTALDSIAVTKLLAFGLSFDLSDVSNTQRLIAYQTAGAAGGFDGLALFTQDVMRSEPFAHAPSIEPGEESGPVAAHGPSAWSSAFLESSTMEHAAVAIEKAEEARISNAAHDHGSNIWVVSGAKSSSGRAMVASDPHLSLGSPATFYEIGLDVSGRDAIKLYGVTFPGTPFVVHGMNEHIAWGSTVNPTDVTDVFQENVVVAGGVPVATIYKGSQEPTQIIPETYRANQVGNGTANDVAIVPSGGAIPAATIVVPRHGPLIAPNLSVQFTGFYPTREPDYFRLLARARDIGDAKRALRYFDFGAQNWMFADDSGNIAYYTDREVPLREDLQAGTVAGLPPYFIRNGTGGNEWIADPTQAEDQALPYEILPAGELDQLVNPARGWISNANQDPTGQTYDNDPLNELRPGGGILYLSPGHSDGNRNARIRARIAAALAGDAAISFGEMQSIQADVQLNDAAVIVPSIVAAMAAARTPGAPPQLATLGADPQLQEAVARLAAWDFSTPTGLPEGYDAADVGGVRAPPAQAEIDASVAATIYSLWRGQALALLVDQPLAAAGLGGFLPGGDQAMTALRRLLVSSTGVGVSGLQFFAGPADRDLKVLTALGSALGLAASPAFAPAFGGSTNLADYRWGKLHRITFAHPLGGPFSIPPGAGFVDLVPGLPGIATDGGFAVVDASSHSPRAATLNGFRFGGGPARRFVAQANRSHPEAVQVIPGGESGNPAGAFFGNQLGLWLTNEYHGATVQIGEIERDALLTQEFTPGS
jgi:penicillin amidase